MSREETLFQLLSSILEGFILVEKHPQYLVLRPLPGIDVDRYISTLMEAFVDLSLVSPIYKLDDSKLVIRLPRRDHIIESAFKEEIWGIPDRFYCNTTSEQTKIRVSESNQ